MPTANGQPLDLVHNVVRVGGDESRRLDGVGVRWVRVILMGE